MTSARNDAPAAPDDATQSGTPATCHIFQLGHNDFRRSDFSALILMAFQLDTKRSNKDQNATNYMQVQDQTRQQANIINFAGHRVSPRAILITVSDRSEEAIYEFRLYVALVAQV